jgi:hypothetical protein
MRLPFGLGFGCLFVGMLIGASLSNSLHRFIPILPNA